MTIPTSSKLPYELWRIAFLAVLMLSNVASSSPVPVVRSTNMNTDFQDASIGDNISRSTNEVAVNKHAIIESLVTLDFHFPISEKQNSNPDPTYTQEQQELIVLEFIGSQWMTDDHWFVSLVHFDTSSRPNPESDTLIRTWKPDLFDAKVELAIPRFHCSNPQYLGQNFNLTTEKDQRGNDILTVSIQSEASFIVPLQANDQSYMLSLFQQERIMRQNSLKHSRSNDTGELDSQNISNTQDSTDIDNPAPKIISRRLVNIPSLGADFHSKSHRLRIHLKGHIWKNLQEYILLHRKPEEEQKFEHHHDFFFNELKRFILHQDFDPSSFCKVILLLLLIFCAQTRSLEWFNTTFERHTPHHVKEAQTVTEPMDQDEDEHGHVRENQQSCEDYSDTQTQDHGSGQNFERPFHDKKSNSNFNSCDVDSESENYGINMEDHSSSCSESTPSNIIPPPVLNRVTDEVSEMDDSCSNDDCNVGSNIQEYGCDHDSKKNKNKRDDVICTLDTKNDLPQKVLSPNEQTPMDHEKENLDKISEIMNSIIEREKIEDVEVNPRKLFYESFTEEENVNALNKSPLSMDDADKSTPNSSKKKCDEQTDHNTKENEIHRLKIVSEKQQDTSTAVELTNAIDAGDDITKNEQGKLAEEQESVMLFQSEGVSKKSNDMKNELRSGALAPTKTSFSEESKGSHHSSPIDVTSKKCSSASYCTHAHAITLSSKNSATTGTLLSGDHNDSRNDVKEKLENEFITSTVNLKNKNMSVKEIAPSPHVLASNSVSPGYCLSQSSKNIQTVCTSIEEDSTSDKRKNESDKNVLISTEASKTKLTRTLAHTQKCNPIVFPCDSSSPPQPSSQLSKKIMQKNLPAQDNTIVTKRTTDSSRKSKSEEDTFSSRSRLKSGRKKAAFEEAMRRVSRRFKPQARAAIISPMNSTTTTQKDLGNQRSIERWNAKEMKKIEIENIVPSKINKNFTCLNSCEGSKGSVLSRSELHVLISTETPSSIHTKALRRSFQPTSLNRSSFTPRSNKEEILKSPLFDIAATARKKMDHYRDFLSPSSKMKDNIPIIPKKRKHSCHNPYYVHQQRDKFVLQDMMQHALSSDNKQTQCDRKEVTSNSHPKKMSERLFLGQRIEQRITSACGEKLREKEHKECMKCNGNNLETKANLSGITETKNIRDRCVKTSASSSNVCSSKSTDNIGNPTTSNDTTFEKTHDCVGIRKNNPVDLCLNKKESLVHEEIKSRSNTFESHISIQNKTRSQPFSKEQNDFNSNEMKGQCSKNNFEFDDELNKTSNISPPLNFLSNGIPAFFEKKSMKAKKRKIVDGSGMLIDDGYSFIAIADNKNSNTRKEIESIIGSTICFRSNGNNKSSARRLNKRRLSLPNRIGKSDLSDITKGTSLKKQKRQSRKTKRSSIID